MLLNNDFVEQPADKPPESIVIQNPYKDLLLFSQSFIVADASEIDEKIAQGSINILDEIPIKNLDKTDLIS